MGTGLSGSTGDGGPATVARINDPISGDFDNNGTYYFPQYGNFIRSVDSFGIIHTIAGTGVAGFSGDGGPATNAQINFPTSCAVDNLGNLFFADAANQRIRRIDRSTGLISTVVGVGSCGFSGDGGPASAASVCGLQGICFDIYNNLFLCDLGNKRIRKVDTFGIITTVAGNGTTGFGGDGGAATNAMLNSPNDVTCNNRGDIFIADYGNLRIRKVDLASGTITTVAGNGYATYTGDGMPATAAQLLPRAIEFDLYGNLYIAENYNQRIRQIDTNLIIHTIAGTGIAGFSGDGSRADSATLYDPCGVAVDLCGNIFIADEHNHRIRKIILTTPSPTDTPTLSITASNDTVCAGTAVTYSATITGGGSTVAYQWFVDTTAVSGATAGSYTYAPAVGDSVRCVVTTWNRCSSNSFGYSNTIHTVVNPVVTPGITITPSPNDTVCSGTAVTYTATITGGGSAPTVQWLVNGSVVATTSSYSYTPANGDSVRCILTSNAPCATVATVSSNTINMVVNSYMDPVISIAPAPNDTVCGGTTVTYTATTSGGGTSPAWQWYVNGTATGTAATYAYTPVNGDSVYCVLTSSYPCSSASADTSNIIHMAVTPVVTPGITISVSPGDTLCNGGMVTLTAGATGGGSSPSYSWLVNGTVVSAATTYTYIPTSGDSISCTLTSSEPCAVPGTVSSNTINIFIAPLVHPSVTLSGPAAAAIGSTVTVTATVGSTGSSYTLHWLNHRVEFATTAVPVVTYTKAAPVDSISARIVSNAYCYDSTTSATHIVAQDNTGTAIITGIQGATWYPNPASTVLNIEAGENIESANLTNVLGQCVLQHAGNSPHAVMPIAQLPSGTYILRINGRVAGRVVKE